MRALFYLLCLFFILPAQAVTVTYCCDVSGVTYCDEGLPAKCVGKAYRELDDRGVTRRTFEAPLTPEQRAKRDAELLKQKKEEERLAAEERADNKLLNTYDSVQELDKAWNRTLENLDASLKQAQDKLAEAYKKKQAIDIETEFYQKRPMPEPLRIQLRDVTREILAQEKNIMERKADIATAKAKFDQERTRYLMLMARKQQAVPPGLASPAVAPARP